MSLPKHAVSMWPQEMGNEQCRGRLLVSECPRERLLELPSKRQLLTAGSQCPDAFGMCSSGFGTLPLPERFSSNPWLPRLHAHSTFRHLRWIRGLLFLITLPASTSPRVRFGALPVLHTSGVPLQVVRQSCCRQGMGWVI